MGSHLNISWEITGKKKWLRSSVYIQHHSTFTLYYFMQRSMSTSAANEQTKAHKWRLPTIWLVFCTSIMQVTKSLCQIFCYCQVSSHSHSSQWIRIVDSYVYQILLLIRSGKYVCHENNYHVDYNFQMQPRNNELSKLDQSLSYFNLAYQKWE